MQNLTCYTLCVKYIATQMIKSLLSSPLSNRQKITVTGVSNGHHARPGYVRDAMERGEILGGNLPNTKKLPGSGPQGHICTSKVMNGGLGQHGVVFQLRFPQWGTVTSDQHKFGYGLRMISSRDLLSLTLQSP